MKKIILFLHGYGSNGSDLISLKNYIKHNPDNTEFISPNAPEPCEFNYFGYQWFPLNERTPLEIESGLKTGFNYLNSIVEKICSDFSVQTLNISLVGFSQGSMLATYYGLTSGKNFYNIISLSGSLPKIILDKLDIKKSTTAYEIFHGKQDDVVNFNQAKETYEFIQNLKLKSKLVLDENCSHSISPLALNMINQSYQTWI